MRCKRDILVCCFSVKPESFLDSNTGVVEDDSSGDTAKILKCTDQGILKAFKILSSVCNHEGSFACTQSCTEDIDHDTLTGYV